MQTGIQSVCSFGFCYRRSLRCLQCTASTSALAPETVAARFPSHIVLKRTVQQ